MWTTTRLYLAGCAISLAGCSGPPPRPQPAIPDELTRPCIVQERDVVTLKDAARLIGDYAEALECANGRLEAIAGLI